MPSVSLPLFDLPIPAPYSGLTPEARQASHSGALAALRGRGVKVARLRALLVADGPLTLNQCHERTGWPLSSICSLKALLVAELEPAGMQIVTWGDGKQTQRTRWRIRG